MYVTKSRVGGSGVAAPTDTKDFGSHVRMITANCGVGAYNPRAIYIRPFCVDTAKFTGDQAQNDGEMPIRKALAPVEFAEDLKEQLEKIAPARILKPGETPRIGWLVDGEFDIVDGGSPVGRFFLGSFGVGQSVLSLHVRVTDVKSGSSSTSLTCMAAVSFREDTEPFAQAGLVVLCTSICKIRPSESI